MILKVGGSGSRGNAYALIADDGEILLIECGIQCKKILRMIDYRVSDVVGCIVSHGHGDHISAYRDVLNCGIPIYTNDETAEHFEVVSGEKMRGVPEKIPFQIGGFKIVPFYVPHTTRDAESGKIIPCPNYGFLIRHPENTVLYATDFEFIPVTFRSFSINTLLIECNHMDDVERDSVHYEHSLRGHSSLSVVKKLVEVNKTPMLQNVILSHLSEENANEKEMVRQVQEVAGKRVKVSVARAGMEEVELNKYPF